MLPADNLSIDQSRILQNLHVPADRRLADLEWSSQLTDRRAALYESSQNAPACAV